MIGTEEQYEQFLAIVAEYKGHQGDQETVVGFLREIQEIYGYLPEETQAVVAQVLGVKPKLVATLIKCYPSLKAQPFKHRVMVCTGPRCKAKGGDLVLAQVTRVLGVGIGKSTSDGVFGLGTQNCFHCCKNGPNLRIDDQDYSGVAPKQVKDLLDKYR